MKNKTKKTPTVPVSHFGGIAHVGYEPTPVGVADTPSTGPTPKNPAPGKSVKTAHTAEGWTPDPVGPKTKA